MMMTAAIRDTMQKLHHTIVYTGYALGADSWQCTRCKKYVFRTKAGVVYGDAWRIDCPVL